MDSYDFSCPFGMLILACTIRDFVKYRKGYSLETTADGINYSVDAHSYLGHVGFFKFIGLSVGKEPGEAIGNSRYLPITIITQRQLKRNLVDRNVHLGPMIQEESERLARIILSVDQPMYGHPVTYCFREIIRNVFEHANTKLCVLAAQAWSDNKLEIALIDQGRGIKKSLEERFSFNNDFEAMLLAIKPGISRIKISQDTDTKWDNTGFGLYVMSSLSRETGHFLLCSGKCGLYAERNLEKQMPFEFRGTAVKLSMTKPKGVNVESLIDRIIQNGERQVKSTRCGHLTASKSIKY